jgi:predicted NUDIX family NTP pyrophosphohydrolase
MCRTASSGLIVYIYITSLMAISAGILAYRKNSGRVEVLLCHPGGPYFKNKDLGSWTIPKGLVDDGEDILEAARREFKEEVGTELPDMSDYIDLGTVKLKSGKVIRAWAVLLEIEIREVSSNTFSIEWPPRSGQYKDFPEVDRAEWYDAGAAMAKLNPAQVPLIERLVAIVE